MITIGEVVGLEPPFEGDPMMVSLSDVRLIGDGKGLRALMKSVRTPGFGDSYCRKECPDSAGCRGGRDCVNEERRLINLGRRA